MKSRNLFLLFGILLTLASCSSSSDPNTSNNGNGSIDSVNLTFKQGTVTKYNEYQLDTNAAPGENKPLAGSQDSLTQTLVATNQSAYGRTDVSIFQNTYLTTGQHDTVYMAQDAAGDVYNYNFGADGMNSNPVVTSTLGGKLDIGWVLQIKMKAAASTKWITGVAKIPVTLPTVGQQNVDLIDTAVMMSDTTIMVNGKSVFAKHARHHINASIKIGGLFSAESIDIYGDTYVSTQLGNTVLNIIHPGTATGVFTAKILGQFMQLTSSSQLK